MTTVSVTRAAADEFASESASPDASSGKRRKPRGREHEEAARGTARYCTPDRGEMRKIRQTWKYLEIYFIRGVLLMLPNYTEYLIRRHQLRPYWKSVKGFGTLFILLKDCRYKESCSKVLAKLRSSRRFLYCLLDSSEQCHSFREG